MISGARYSGVPQRECAVSPSTPLLGEAKVRDADVTLRIQDEILRLQVTVNDVVVVEMADPHRDFGGVELGSVLR